MNRCMQCWEAILPHTVRHISIGINLIKLLDFYQSRYPGAMYWAAEEVTFTLSARNLCRADSRSACVLAGGANDESSHRFSQLRRYTLSRREVSRRGGETWLRARSPLERPYSAGHKRHEFQVSSARKAVFRRVDSLRGPYFAL